MSNITAKTTRPYFWSLARFATIALSMMLTISVAVASTTVEIQSITFDSDGATLDLGDGWELDAPSDQVGNALDAAECITKGGKAYAVLTLTPDGELSIGIVDDCRDDDDATDLQLRSQVSVELTSFIDR